MRRAAIIAVVTVLIGISAWAYFGGIDRVTAGRIEATLVEHGVPRPLARCMSGRMVDRLTISQLRKLERLSAQEGENPVPLSTGELLARIRRIDDPQAVEVTVTAAALCAIQASPQSR